MQTEYPQTMDPSFAGMVADSSHRNIEGFAAFENIDFGRGVVNGNANDDIAKLPKRNTATIVFDGDLVTSNTINGKLNGTAIAQVTYATSHLNTMNLIKTALETVLTALTIEAAVTVGGASNRTITIVAEDASLLFADWVVAAGAGQAGVTHAYTTADFFRGVAIAQHKSLRSDGTAGYIATETVNVLRVGKVWVKVTSAVIENADAYCVLADSAEEGFFTDVSTGNIGPVGKFRSAAADNALAILELNMP